MIIYGSSLSPYVRKVLAFAAEKGIDLELQGTGMPNYSPEYLAASPFRKMPALVDGDYTLADSSAIIHYLEAKHPEPALIPAEPRARGKVIWFDEFSDTIFTACGAKMFFNRIVAPRFLGREGDLAAADTAEREELPPILDYWKGSSPMRVVISSGIALRLPTFPSRVRSRTWLTSIARSITLGMDVFAHGSIRSSRGRASRLGSSARRRC